MESARTDGFATVELHHHPGRDPRGLEGVPLGPLRYLPRLPYWIERDSGGWEELLAGPAMLAPILAWPNGNLIGLHITWLDDSRPGTKLRASHPDTGELLPAKKVRGRKAGGFIPLSPGRGRARLVVGEGIETVLTMRLALARHGLDHEIGFWSAIDLGNLAGRATETVPHPTMRRQAGGRTVRVRVPGPEPDRESPAVPIPDEVTDLVLLKDGDSDPFLTDLAMYRAARRFACVTRSVRVAEPAVGLDFNDMVRRS